jgi:hypothetical protein
MLCADQVRDAMRYDARLAAAGAGQYEHGALGKFDGLALFGVQAFQEIHEGSTDSYGDIEANGFCESRGSFGAWRRYSL